MPLAIEPPRWPPTVTSPRTEPFCRGNDQHGQAWEQRKGQGWTLVHPLSTLYRKDIVSSCARQPLTAAKPCAGQLERVMARVRSARALTKTHMLGAAAREEVASLPQIAPPSK